MLTLKHLLPANIHDFHLFIDYLQDNNNQEGQEVSDEKHQTNQQDEG